MSDEQKSAALKKARVILDHGDHRIDDVISGPGAEQAIAAGYADGHPSAVAYAEKLARRKARAAADAAD